MKILGIHVGHDSSAAVIEDGNIIADVQEERFTRVKHSNNVPIASINYCLKMAGLNNINEFDYISFSWLNTSKMVKTLFGLQPQKSSAQDRIKGFIKKSLGIDYIIPPIYFPNFKLNDPSKFITNEHHLVHAASAYYSQESTADCLIFTIDGAGDGVSTAVWLGKGNSITPLVKYSSQEAAPGYGYSIVTEALHLIHGDGEGTTMGLAPYGDYTKCKGVLDDYFPEFKDDVLVKKSNLDGVSYWNENGSTQFHMEEAWEVEKLIKIYGKENIANEAQRKLEDNLMNFIFGWCKKTGIKNIACSGGVFLNVKLNQRIWNNRGNIIEKQHIYPNPGDAGLAAGAAYLEYYRHNEFKGNVIKDLYKGPEYTNEEIKELFRIRKLNYEYVENPSIMAAELLAEGKIIAWFQGRMEAGPRALGNRSILMSPIKQENKDIINAWVKFREGFRPFCPSILYGKKDLYIKDARDEFFMITSFDTMDAKKDKVPAVVHVDGTLRPQFVKKETNPKYWELINKFGELTGEYVILNTSFNIKGEPIINNPKEAIRCFFDTGLDGIFINNFYLKK
jgi:carbamoyltransferase